MPNSSAENASRVSGWPATAGVGPRDYGDHEWGWAMAPEVSPRRARAVLVALSLAAFAFITTE
ncbi:hypothetical protein, partial [Micromonospora sp. NPDC005173]|uniref:hypothetical protein n=1 Tax=Micromonospora sp. NPDC005173 TaxID=3157165 RepID=UPI0033B334D0